MDKFDENQCEPLCIKTSNTLHTLEGTMKQTPFHISEGGENMYGGLPRARSPFYEGPSSICENMEVLPSRDDQDLGSLIDDEAFSFFDEEDEHRRNTRAV